MKRKLLIEPHLSVKEHRQAKGGEWMPRFRGWCVAHIDSGVCYWNEQSGMREVPSGSTLVFSSEARATLRASQLNDVAIIYFHVETAKLIGLLSVREQHVLQQMAGRKDVGTRYFAPESAISLQFKNLAPRPGVNTSSVRLRLLQLFMDVFTSDIDQSAAAPGSRNDSREKLRQVLNQMPASEFADLSVSDLAPIVACSPRHLNRLFRAELGASFREKQIQYRMARACELLATSDAKVINVALESGYQSSSVFSELFKKHVGVSPGQWRRQHLKSEPAAQLLP